MDNQDPFSAFTCKRCGNCCQGEGGIILTPADVDRLRAHLNMGPKAFADSCTETVGGKQRLRTNDQGWCIFFTDGCTVHPAKPSVCRAWPFFRGNMVDESSWQMAQGACPGISPGSGHMKFVAQGQSYLDSLEIEPPSDTSPNALRSGRDKRDVT